MRNTTGIVMGLTLDIACLTKLHITFAQLENSADDIKGAAEYRLKMVALHSQICDQAIERLTILKESIK